MGTEPNTPEVVEVELVESKAEAAYRMVRAGKSLSDVAQHLGYGSGEAVHHAITHRVATDGAFMAPGRRQSILEMELVRLEELREHHYEAAMTGDLRSAEILLKIHDRVVKVVGGDKLDTETQQHTVLVVGGKEADYLQSLKELAE